MENYTTEELDAIGWVEEDEEDYYYDCFDETEEEDLQGLPW